MTIPYNSALRRIGIHLVFVTVLACDTFKEDEIEPEKQVTFSKTEYYTVPGSSIVIDLKASIKKAFSSVSLSISENPEKGILTQIDSFLFKYTPGVDFVEGQDQFVLGSTLGNGSIVKSESMLIYVKKSVEDFPCGIHTVEDYARSNTTNATVIHILNNDRICPGAEVDFFIRLKPKFGDAQVIGDSIVYMPNSPFLESDELVYGIRSAGEIISYGLVSFNKMRMETFATPLSMTHIFFVDDELGFGAGGSSIYKTKDGGRHWAELAFHKDGAELIGLTGIFFPDEDHGFASFYTSELSDDPVSKSGWLMTNDGGLSWKRTDLDSFANSILFTSPLVGFVSTFGSDGLSGFVHTEIWKTVDGGSTWDKVFFPVSNSHNTSIRFANASIGYAVQPGAIYGTKDGGDTWSEIIANNYITSFALAGDDVVCASFSSSVIESLPSTIVRSEGGSPFRVVGNFPYPIRTQGFSPSGDLGIAVGVSGTIDPDTDLWVISRSTDKGQTWTNVPVVVHGFVMESSVPSNDVAYILCSGKIIKCSN